MSAADAETKAYLSNAERFADVFNFWLYDGAPIIKAEELRQLDTTAIALPYGDDARQPIQKFRDVLKLYTAMQDDSALYLVLGIEAQSHVHYAMAVRNMLYDAMNYAQQVKNKTDAHRKAGAKMTSDEFLSGFGKDDLLMPVITLVINFSGNAWDAPTSLHEMLAVKNKKLLQFVPDYRINLLSPEKIADPDFDKFRTGLGAVMQFIKHQQDESMDWLKRNRHMENMDWDTASLIQTVSGKKICFDEKGDAADMWKAWDKSMEQARQDGEAQGRDSERIYSIKKVMEKFHLTAKEAMDTLEIPDADRERYATQV